MVQAKGQFTESIGFGVKGLGIYGLGFRVSQLGDLGFKCKSEFRDLGV